MSGFKKKVVSKTPAIPGTTLSPKNLQLLTSSGVKSLDNLLNGGLPIGTIVLFEDFYQNGNISLGSTSAEKGQQQKTNYSKILLHHFLNEGITNGHDLFVGSSGAPFSFSPGTSTGTKMDTSSCSSDTGINKGISDTESSEEKSANSSSEEKLRIAWRYQNQSAAVSPKECSDSKTSAKSDNTSPVVNKTDITTWNITDLKSESFFSKSDIYHEIFKAIHDACSKTNYLIETLGTTPYSSNLIRIGIVDLGAATACDQDIHICKLLQFLYALKSLRNRLCVIALTQTTNIREALDSSSVQGQVRELVDFVFRICAHRSESSIEQEHSKDENHGAFFIEKTPSLKSLKSASLRNHGQYTFKSSRNKFTIERLHLPPELSMGADTPTKQSIDF